MSVAVWIALGVQLAGLLLASPVGAAPQPAASGAGAWEVKLWNVRFAPNSITIEVGDSVTFANHDSMCHTVTRGAPAAGDCIGSGSQKEADFDVVLNDQGDNVTITFTAEGDVTIYCKPHIPQMTLTISVVKPGTPPPKPTPGFEALALFAGLAGAAAVAGVILARKRKVE